MLDAKSRKLNVGFAFGKLNRQKIFGFSFVARYICRAFAVTNQPEKQTFTLSGVGFAGEATGTGPGLTTVIEGSAKHKMESCGTRTT